MKQASYLSVAQCEEIESALPEDVALACKVMRQTGLRVSDVLHLKVLDVIRSGVLSVRERKTGKWRTVDLGDLWFAAAKKAWASGARGSLWLFPGRSRDGTMGRYKLHRAIRSSARKLGYISTVSPHSWRKCYAVEYMRQHSFLELKAELHHSSMATTAIYAYSDQISPAKKKATESCL